MEKKLSQEGRPNDTRRTCHTGHSIRSVTLVMTMTHCVARWETKAVMTATMLLVRTGIPQWYRHTHTAETATFLTTTHNIHIRQQQWHICSYQNFHSLRICSFSTDHYETTAMCSCSYCLTGNFLQPLQIRPVPTSKPLGIGVEVLFTGLEPFLLSNQQCQSNEGRYFTQLLYFNILVRTKYTGWPKK